MGRSLCPLMWFSATNTSFKNYGVEQAERDSLGDHLVTQMGPHGGGQGEHRASHGKVCIVQALLLRFSNSGALSVSLDLTKFLG